MNSVQLIEAPKGVSGIKEITESFLVNGDDRIVNASVTAKEHSVRTSLHYLVLFSTFSLMVGAAVMVYCFQSEFRELQNFRIDHPVGKILAIVSIFLFIFQMGFFGFMYILHKRYKPVASVADAELPMCTVIVPAYNEGKLVLKTLRSLAESDYPVEKLQLICIDDGSKDDTWQWMKRAKKELGERVSIYQQPKNMGKRHALYRGFQLAKGDIFVTVDSDSIVLKDTLRNMVSPFIVNELCGAVAGNVRVLNAKKAMIPKMLNVSFAFSFEFFRSAQSMLGTVLCTPGALSAYRKTAVMNCLNDWINQTFMGQRSDIGEDRAMTNMIMKQGYEIRFQSNAHVLTDTPEKYKNLYKMFIRWERSNVRENIMMSKFAFTNFRKGGKAGARLLLINQWIRVIMAYPFTLLMLMMVVFHPLLFISSTLVGILVFSSLPAIFFARRHNFIESIWAYSYGIFHTFALFWIMPYAIATASRRGWLTGS